MAERKTAGKALIIGTTVCGVCDAMNSMELGLMPGSKRPYIFCTRCRSEVKSEEIRRIDRELLNKGGVKDDTREAAKDASDIPVV